MCVVDGTLQMDLRGQSYDMVPVDGSKDVFQANAVYLSFSDNLKRWVWSAREPSFDKTTAEVRRSTPDACELPGIFFETTGRVVACKVEREYRRTFVLTMIFVVHFESINS